MTKKFLGSLAATALLAACGDDSTPVPTTGQITFIGDTTFNGPHANQTMRGALVRVSDGATLDIRKTTVAPTGTSPAFSFTFAPTVDLAAAHRVRYWADHNSNDACDAPPVDHQWQADVPAGQGSVTVSHSTSFTDVCGTFTFPLTFVGNTTFNGPHASQDFGAALVRGTAATALQTVSGTVGAAGANPAFSVAFTPRLVIGEQYSVKLWVDFDASGLCEAPPTDHQWSVPIPADFSTYQPTFTYTHNTTFTDVCSYFP
ncbi:MAG TPA: hypothetical protein VFI16_06410 [Anaeromyxobacteraceae bacterium]|nr:hypothetical protein [Anaeromyxobacteraceae bacterium]